MAAARRRKLDRTEVEKLVDELLAQGNIDKSMLFTFAETINGTKFKEAKAPKKKAMTMTEARKAVLDTFGCKTAADLKKNKTFSMSLQKTYFVGGVKNKFFASPDLAGFWKGPGYHPPVQNQRSLV